MTLDFIGADLTLAEWLKRSSDDHGEPTVQSYMFPTEAHRDEFIDSIASRPELQVRRVLERLLIRTGTLGCDRRHAEFFLSQKSVARTEYERRTILHHYGAPGVFPWGGIAWILDLLPDYPREALEALSAYLSAHLHCLPDGRISGLQDALDVIRAKYVGGGSTDSEKVKQLLSLEPRRFERLVENLYLKMGYQTTLTPAQKDGGRDIQAVNTRPGTREVLLIECKLYSGAVPVSKIRELLGVVSDEKVNKGVLVCATRFTKPARDFAASNPRIELVDGPSLVSLLNEHMSPTWAQRIESILISTQVKERSPDKSAR